jgi:hypothetical protein
VQAGARLGRMCKFSENLGEVRKAALGKFPDIGQRLHRERLHWFLSPPLKQASIKQARTVTESVVLSPPSRNASCEKVIPCRIRLMFKFSALFVQDASLT